ncbi:hypothetical protein [Streptomyces chartreusis]|uniref:hypothetical protein n=1 Tax=Streptomyces chartreusis TaxID=1969 RepID=UPI002100A49F|nr:hypothetical protein [Streptomyces chartreusis]
MTAPHEPESRGAENEEFNLDNPTPAWYQAAESTDQVPWYSVAPDGPPITRPISCKQCGATPAASVQIRSHLGLLLWMRCKAVDGPFCSHCGIALIRVMTTKTLWQGWWGPLSLLATLFALHSNLDAYRDLRRLPRSAPPSARARSGMGKPVHRRPPAYVALIPLCCAIWLLTSLIGSAS